MAKATWVPLSYLVERGQQIKVFSQLTKKAREMGYIVPTIAVGTGYWWMDTKVRLFSRHKRVRITHR